MGLNSLEVHPPTEADKELAALCKALGHPARSAILRRLIAQPGCVCGQLVEQLPLAQATVSQHLKVLKEAGLVIGEVDGPRVCYCIDPECIDDLQQLIHELIGEGATSCCSGGTHG